MISVGVSSLFVLKILHCPLIKIVLLYGYGCPLY